ncbi:MAG: hypothetical protein ACREA0_26495, partial [bacterium]
VRLFVFGDDGSLRRLPKELAGELVAGRTRLQEYAGRTLRIADVILKIEGGRPVQVVRVTGSFWHFDERGSIQGSLAGSAIENLETHQALQKETAASDGPAVEISARLARERWKAKNRWEPTPADITKIVNSIWPKSAGRPVEPLRSIEASWERKTPVSREAKRALGRIWDHVREISHELGELDERSLTNVVEDSRENMEDTFPTLWEGIAQAAERELERRKGRKSPKEK